MAGKYVMALDQGTTSSRAIVFDKHGNIIAKAQNEFDQIYPKAGWVEHDPLKILYSQLNSITEVLNSGTVDAADIAGIGITNQRETTILWDRSTGKPVYNAIVWQCRRTADMCEKIKEDKELCDYITEHTGLIIDAYFSATKIKWILDNVPGVKALAEADQLLFGTVETWLIWNLTGGRVHVTDYSNASRTILFNIYELHWDEFILEKLNIPECMLPEVKPSSCVYGKTVFELYGGEIPVAGAAGDQQAALFGQCCIHPGDMKNTYGTGCFLLMNTGKTPVISKNGLVTTIAVGFEDHVLYALEGSVFVAGAAIQWLRDELNVLEKASESQVFAESVPDSAGGYVVPAFTGLGAPYWNQRARGVIVGLTRGFNRSHLVRATLESLAYQSYDICKAMEHDSGIPIKSLKVDGGACANNFLMQFQSDILDCEVTRPSCIETTALGAAYLAGLAVGYWESVEEIKDNWSIDRVFTSQMDEEIRTALVHGWHKAVKCALLWGED